MEFKGAKKYSEEKERIGDFFRKFNENTSDNATAMKYLSQLDEIYAKTRTIFMVDLDDVASMDNGEEFASDIAGNTRRYIEQFAAWIDDEIAKIAGEGREVSNENDTVLDVFIQHRIILAQNNANVAQNVYPKALMRKYEIVFIPRSIQKISSIREVDAAFIGKLVTVEGIVIRATAVKPSISVATYACDACGCEVYENITGPSFLPRTQCDSKDCQANKRRGKLHLQTRGSKFVKFQEIKIQELSKHVPTGHVPRSLTIHAYGEATRNCMPGDQIEVSGIFLPTPYTGFRQIRAGLLSDTFLEALIIRKEKKSHTERTLSLEMEEEIRMEAESPDIYNKLASSLCPEIYGHDDVKKALLLLLVGGTARNMKDGMKIRGDINVCLMGDPGVAKSQMLKSISEIAPRAVYTTGRGSSGVGLTAAVTRDPFTNEIVLEGGALVLADRGICCIDEFDKMDESDRTAIHEVMEQQTVSIAKAGITTTLNARTSILAAANPLMGRYDSRKTMTQNINLPTALLSRFDLMFLLLDRPDLELDQKLAQHITHLHTYNDYPPTPEASLSKDFVRNYVALAKKRDPVILPELRDHICGHYVVLRNPDRESDNNGTPRVTARALLGILRLSTALARLRLSDEVCEADINEAIRLNAASKESLIDSRTLPSRGRNPTNDIYHIITKTLLPMAKHNTVSYVEIENAVQTKGYSVSQLETCIEEYENLGVWQLSVGKESLIMLQTPNA